MRCDSNDDVVGVNDMLFEVMRQASKKNIPVKIFVPTLFANNINKMIHGRWVSFFVCIFVYLQRYCISWFCDSKTNICICSLQLMVWAMV